MKIYTQTFDLARPTVKRFWVAPYSDYAIGIKVVNNGVAVNDEVTVTDEAGTTLTAETDKVNGYSIYIVSSTDTGTSNYTIACKGQVFKLTQNTSDSTVYEKKNEEVKTEYVIAIGNIDDGVLSRASISSVVEIDDNALEDAYAGNTNLVNVSFPNTTTVGDEGLKNTFAGCTGLKTADLSKLSTVGTDGMSGTFSGCTALEIVLFQSSTAVPSISENTFANTNDTFKVIVPDALYEDWIAAENWSDIASQITKVSDWLTIMTNYGGYDNMDDNN